MYTPHPQPFSPEYRGEGSKNLFVVDCIRNLDSDQWIVRICLSSLSKYTQGR